MREKHSRIFQAASELFAERGYESVTTQAISDRADVGAGTLFRYAASKGELLLMVYNERFRAALEVGESDASAATDEVGAATALLIPAVLEGQDNVENSAAYQRELLFGAPGERYRSEGLALVGRLEQSIANRLRSAASRAGLNAGADAVRVASASVFATMHLAIARQWTGAHEGANAVEDLRLQVAQIVAGFLATTGRAGQPGDVAGSAPAEGEKKQ